MTTPLREIREVDEVDARVQGHRPSVAILGTRGVPAQYGGFETFAAKLAEYLLSKNFPVSAYGIEGYQQDDKAALAGLNQIWMHAPKHRALEKTIAAWTSVVHASLSDAEVILMLGVSPALLSILPKLRGKRVIINLDGMEWKRRKWGRLAKGYLYLCEQHAKQIAHATIVDSRALLPYHQNHRGPAPHLFLTEPIRFFRTRMTMPSFGRSSFNHGATFFRYADWNRKIIPTGSSTNTSQRKLTFHWLLLETALFRLLTSVSS